MKTQNRIPSGKAERTGEFLKTGAKIGVNFLKHYARQMVASEPINRELLHEENAKDVYDSLSKLRGSALKVAQMMSMDKALLPRQYAEKFQMSQYSVPPLSAPLVIQSFLRAFGKNPDSMFDQFSLEASNAASIGQVHAAVKDGRRLAVKIQYPGVAASIRSDLKMVKPFAVRLMGLNEADVDLYSAEVEARLLEETDYDLELKRSREISLACSHLENLIFPNYFPDWSSRSILTMDWLPGLHLPEFLDQNPSQELRDRAGQALWDFYEFQIHSLRQVHADPHPGNFLIQPDGSVGVIDFGCIKVIPDKFYHSYFALINPDSTRDEMTSLRLFTDLEFIHDTDGPKERAFFIPLFKKMISMLGKPFQEDYFDFGDEDYFSGIYRFAEELAAMPEIRNSKKARGSRDGLYINRTYFGLYSLLNQLKARIRTHSSFPGNPVKRTAASQIQVSE
jgi:predicted unusual protein kinase regulating ubiquinone biosynthesis (AarF/ABC1/UbiB family)